jgi:hypothetical protein
MSTEATPQLAINKWVGVIGLFIAPTTIITSVCYYFGYIWTRKYLSYFGIDSNAIGYTSSDYVLKSVNVLFAPILVLVLVAAVALWVVAYTRRLAQQDRGTRVIRVAGWTAIGIGVALTARGVVGVVRPHWEMVHGTLLTALALCAGPIALVVGCWLLSAVRARTTPEPFTNARLVSLVAAGAVIVMALFWLTNIFATGYGESEAKSTAAELWSKETGVTLYTGERLGAPSNLVVESPVARTNSTDVGQPAGASSGAFRYLCLRVLLVRGDRWVLVPARWTPEYGYAVIVDANPSNRLSVLRLKGIGDTGAVNWSGNWVCPELAPPTASFAGDANPRVFANGGN